MKHKTKVTPSSAKIVDNDGKVSELPKQRAPTWRSKCSCIWSSQEFATEAQARTAGQAHERLMGGKA